MCKQIIEVEQVNLIFENSEELVILFPCGFCVGWVLRFEKMVYS